MAASTLLTALADPVLAAAVLARMSAAVFAGALPLTDQVPFKVRGVLAVCLTVLALPAAGHSRAASLAAQPLPIVIVGEAVVGLGLGLVVAAIVAAAAWAGGLLGSVSGLSWADDFATPSGDPEPTGVARLAWWLGLAGFFAAGGHLAVVTGLLESVRVMPVGSLFAVGGSGGAESPLVAVVTAAPALALALVMALAVPALAAVVTFHLALAICLRTVRFDPGQGLLQALAAIVVMFTFIAGAEAWLGGFGAVAHAQIERSFAGEPAHGP
jgi:flagellar biosynthesis protein FliR